MEKMRVYVDCPKCGIACKKVLDKTMSINRDMLFQCPYCKCIIPIRLFKTKTNNIW